jgi:hypothetical protein
VKEETSPPGATSVKYHFPELHGRSEKEIPLVMGWDRISEKMLLQKLPILLQLDGRKWLNKYL